MFGFGMPKPESLNDMHKRYMKRREEEKREKRVRDLTMENLELENKYLKTSFKPNLPQAPLPKEIEEVFKRLRESAIEVSGVGQITSYRESMTLEDIGNKLDIIINKLGERE
jgi:hypothetical protein